METRPHCPGPGVFGTQRRSRTLAPASSLVLLHMVPGLFFRKQERSRLKGKSLLASWGPLCMGIDTLGKICSEDEMRKCGQRTDTGAFRAVYWWLSHDYLPNVCLTGVSATPSPSHWMGDSHSFSSTASLGPIQKTQEPLGVSPTQSQTSERGF